ncbi:hypothetical protein K737_300016 [Holospora undulata HU1]|uniref:Tc1-like transposase DDE domain-containing protein n=1 Tax=Holospora undulata HU1 TaxID=1321371 RepID=A0A061JIR0_9PROT|nr:hypothetical protein K737_300016 [Holospora undulata HU1]
MSIHINVFLSERVKKYPSNKIALIMDEARWHKSKKSKVNKIEVGIKNRSNIYRIKVLYILMKVALIWLCASTEGWGRKSENSVGKKSGK